jgi:hypothetical protein
VAQCCPRDGMKRNWYAGYCGSGLSFQPEGLASPLSLPVQSRRFATGIYRSSVELRSLALASGELGFRPMFPPS